MSELEKRFESAIEQARFNVLEMKGFQSQPKLAIMAGMAIGYKMALNDLNTTRAAEWIGGRNESR